MCANMYIEACFLDRSTTILGSVSGVDRGSFAVIVCILTSMGGSFIWMVRHEG